MAWKFTEIEPREATHKEIETIHSPSYVEYIAGTAGERSVFLDPDTATSPETYKKSKEKDVFFKGKNKAKIWPCQ